MELACVLLVLLLPFLPLLRMLLAMKPGSRRRLARPDLAAFFVLTTGIAIALAIVRAVAGNESLLFVTIVVAFALPLGLAIAWFARFVWQEFCFHFRRRRRQFREVSFSEFTKVGKPSDDDVLPR